MHSHSRRCSPLLPRHRCAGGHAVQAGKRLHGISGRHRSRGIALALTLGVVLLLVLAAVTAYRNASAVLSAASLGLYERQARCAAEAGLADAIVAIRAVPDWSGFVPARRSLPSAESLSYIVDVTRNDLGVSSSVAPDGTQVPPGTIYLHATGYASQGMTRVVTALATRSDGRLFRYAVFGSNGVSTSGGTVVDAWDSALGPYGPSTLVPDGADVGTNATSAGALSFGGGTRIEGDLYVGPGADPTVAIAGADAASGTVNVNPSRVPLALLSPPSSEAPSSGSVKVANGQTRTLAPGTYGDLTVSGGVLTLTGGTYAFTAGRSASGSILVKGGGVIKVAPGAGPVRVFFSGSWDSQGGAIINPSGLASNLVFVAAPSVTSVTLVGNTDATYGFYAPTADLKITGGSDIAGGLVGASVRISSSTGIHFDAGLLDLVDLRGVSEWGLSGIHR